MRFPRIFPRRVKFLTDTHIECEGRFDRFEVEITVDHQTKLSDISILPSVGISRDNDGWRPYIVTIRVSW